MYFHLQQPAYSLATRELLFVGFGHAFDANISGYPYHNEHYAYELLNDTPSALQWLKSRVDQLETFQLPYAIFFELHWLDTHPDLLREIQHHPDLCFVPLIALASPGQQPDRNALLAKGLDDCYCVPVDWNRLETRLEFLNQYKAVLMDQSAALQPESFQFRLPRAKRVFDVLMASSLLLATSIIWVPTAIAIRLESKGPVIYRSRRAGAHYRVFKFWKFRSMYHDADQRLNDFLALNQYREKENGQPVFFKLTRDPRVTRVGRFIRKYSIDELPQLINVLRGEMSIVGNRPLPLYEAQTLTRNEWCARFLAPAGLTGLWQVSRRGQSEMSAEERIALDIAYYQNYSVWTDVRILFLTLKAFIQKEDV